MYSHAVSSSSLPWQLQSTKWYASATLGFVVPCLTRNWNFSPTCVSQVADSPDFRTNFFPQRVGRLLATETRITNSLFFPPHHMFSWSRVMNCARYNLFSLNRHFKCNRALFSTQSAVKEQRIVHTNESDPRNHTEDHLGLYYRVPDEVFDRIFKLAGFQYAQSKFISVVKDHSIMIRKPALDIISYLKRTDFSKPANKYVICESILNILFTARSNFLLIMASFFWYILFRWQKRPR